MTFCTDKSLGMGLHINEAQEMRRWNPIFSDLDQPRQPGEYPPWFKHYKEAANETKHGLLILQLTDSYLQLLGWTDFFVGVGSKYLGCERIRMCLMLFADLLRSKACRWEFGYIRKPELVHVYVPSGNNSPGRIVKWEELMEDAELCKQLFGEALGRTIQGNLDAEDPRTMQGTFTQLEKMAETAEEQEHQAWCELPFRQLAYNFASEHFRGGKCRHHVERRQSDCCLPSNWICSQSPTNWKGFVGEKGEEIWQRPLKRSHNFGKSGQCAWRS